MMLLIRGLPGSGKSTYAKNLSSDGHYAWVEADMYFCTPNGYEFDPTKLDAAHSWCQREAAKALQENKSVIISNTFTRSWEAAPYRDMAKVYNVPFHVITMFSSFKSIHNIPDKSYENMRLRFVPHNQFCTELGVF